MNFYLVPFGCVWTWGIPSTSGQSNWCGILVFIRSYKFQTNHIERCFQQSAPIPSPLLPGGQQSPCWANSVSLGPSLLRIPAQSSAVFFPATLIFVNDFFGVSFVGWITLYNPLGCGGNVTVHLHVVNPKGGLGLNVLAKRIQEM
jgi:hypothetical protein